jgi:hypothetical protein
MAKPVTVTVSHELGREKAVERIRNGFDQLGGTLGAAVKMDQRWERDTLHFSARLMGQGVSGRLDVRDKDVVIELLLPALLAGMAQRIAAKMKQKSALLLEKK